MFLVLFVAAGDPAPAVNEAHYLCRLKHFWDPAWCRGDLFLESRDAHFTVVWLAGWVTRLLSLATTAWLGRLVAWGLLAVAWTRVVRRFTPRPGLPALGAALLAWGTRDHNFAGEWLVGGFEAKSLAYGVVLLALADALDGRWSRSAALVGLATGLHALVGGWFGVALAVAAWGTGQAPPARRVLPGAAVGLLLAAAGVAPALTLNAGVPSDLVREANETYVFYRLPHHLAPLSKGGPWFAERLLAHLGLVAALAIVAWRARDGRDPGLRLVTRLAWVAEGISLCGLAIEAGLAASPGLAASLLKYYWFRLADVVAPLALALHLVRVADVELSLRPLRGLAVAAALGGLGATHLAETVARRVAWPNAPADVMLADPVAWREITDWIAANTPPDAVFLVPHGSHSFKWRAGRAEVVTYKDIPQDAASMVEWRRRRTDVFQAGFDETGAPLWTPSLASLGANRLRELGERYGARFVLDEAPTFAVLAGVPQRRTASLPVTHRVGPYTLYDLGPPPRGR